MSSQFSVVSCQLKRSEEKSERSSQLEERGERRGRGREDRVSPQRRPRAGGKKREGGGEIPPLRGPTHQKAARKRNRAAPAGMTVLGWRRGAVGAGLRLQTRPIEARLEDRGSKEASRPSQTQGKQESLRHREWNKRRRRDPSTTRPDAPEGGAKEKWGPALRDRDDNFGVEEGERFGRGCGCKRRHRPSKDSGQAHPNYARDSERREGFGYFLGLGWDWAWAIWAARAWLISR